jgi:hypothetical protein
MAGIRPDAFPDPRLGGGFYWLSNPPEALVGRGRRVPAMPCTKKVHNTHPWPTLNAVNSPPASPVRGWPVSCYLSVPW